MGLFRLALLLGKTVSELDISWREFLYWNAYLKLEPPDKSDNERLAVLLAQITNMSGKSLRPGKTVEPGDFLEKPKEKVIAEQISFMKRLGK